MTLLVGCAPLLLAITLVINPQFTNMIQQILNFESIVQMCECQLQIFSTRNSESRNKAVKMAQNYVNLGQRTKVRVHLQMQNEIFYYPFFKECLFQLYLKCHLSTSMQKRITKGPFTVCHHTRMKMVPKHKKQRLIK